MAEKPTPQRELDQSKQEIETKTQDEEVCYDEKLYKFRRQVGTYKNENDEMEDIKKEYNRSRNRYYGSFRAIDTINVINLMEKWEKDHDDKEGTPQSTMAALILEQKIVNWTTKYKKDPRNIKKLVESIILDKNSLQITLNQ